MRAFRALGPTQKRLQSSDGPESAFSRATPKVREILDKALSQTCHMGTEDAALLLTTSGSDLRAVCVAADELRRRAVGDTVTWVVNRNINFTNACVRKCGFCAFSRTAATAEAYFLPLAEIERRAAEAVNEFGATEICVQAGLPPAMPADLYESVAAAVKAAVPAAHLHAFSPSEVDHGAKRKGASAREFLRLLKAAGVDSLPGTSAEILDDDVRRRLGRQLSTARWLEIVGAAHEEGLTTTATMMYGHVETPLQVAQHLAILRELQLKTGGITEFVPLSFVAAEAPAYREGTIAGMRAGPTGREVLAVHAVSRLMLDRAINNIQVSWPKEGLRMAQLTLDCGVNDLGGTLMNESISVAAGAGHGQLARPAEFRTAIADAGRVPAQRDTRYRILRTFGAQAGAEGDREMAPQQQRLDALPQHEADERFGSYRQLVASPDHRYKAQFGRQQRRALSSSSSNLSGSGKPAETPGSSGLEVVTFSSSFTVVPTYECFNACSYCNFRKSKSPWLTTEAATATLRQLRRQQCSGGAGEEEKEDVPLGSAVREILIMSGEMHPASPRRRPWIQRVLELCEVALSLGFQPHTNVGPLSFEEMALLRDVNASMGLMLEQVTPKLTAKGGVHRWAPSKRPEVRLAQLRQAGELRVPFTTGVLVGVGEAAGDSVATLEAIAEVANEFKHVQECIIQPYSVGGSESRASEEAAAAALAELPSVVAAARRILPADVVVQVPPNLVHNWDVLVACLQAGARDLGGWSPKDEVNPSYQFPTAADLATRLKLVGFELRERDAVHRRYRGWLPTRVSKACGWAAA